MTQRRATASGVEPIGFATFDY